MSGKTTNIIQIYRSLRPGLRGRLVSLHSEAERTLFFDFLPVELGRVRGYSVRLHLYSVPGQVFHAATRKLVFRGVDGIVFVADSRIDRLDADLEAQRDLRENLDAYQLELHELPYVLQLNKRDLGETLDVDSLTELLRMNGEPVYQAIALENQGVQETLKEITRQIMFRLERALKPTEETAHSQFACQPDSDEQLLRA
jgi:signal recognition particle receptor subunit beta